MSLVAAALPVARCPSQGSRAAGCKTKERDDDGGTRDHPASLSVSLNAAPLTGAPRQASQGSRAAGSARVTTGPEAPPSVLSLELDAPENKHSVRAPSQGSRAAGRWFNRGP